MKKILTLDLATKTGWATNTPTFLSGVENFQKRAGESRGMRYLRFACWLKDIVTQIEPDLIVYEQAHMRGRAATEVALGFLALLEKACARYGLQYTPCHTSTLKRFATGKGNASKTEMIRAYKKAFKRDPIDDNECDARFLLEWAMQEYK